MSYDHDDQEFDTEPVNIKVPLGRIFDDLVELNEIVGGEPDAAELRGSNDPKLQELEIKSRRLQQEYDRNPTPELLEEIEKLRGEYDAAIIDKDSDSDT
jgi:hypothetical protein